MVRHVVHVELLPPTGRQNDFAFSSPKEKKGSDGRCREICTKQKGNRIQISERIWKKQKKQKIEKIHSQWWWKILPKKKDELYAEASSLLSHRNPLLLDLTQGFFLLLLLLHLFGYLGFSLLTNGVSVQRLAHPGGPLKTNKAAALAKFLHRKLNQDPNALSSINPQILDLAVRNAKASVHSSSYFLPPFCISIFLCWDRECVGYGIELTSLIKSKFGMFVFLLYLSLYIYMMMMMMFLSGGTNIRHVDTFDDPEVSSIQNSWI